jgi:tRNA (guanine-N7-)-methyltransferase
VTGAYARPATSAARNRKSLRLRAARRTLAPVRGRDRESTSGVPFPGRPLPRERWSRTRVGLGAPGHAFDWAAAFGRDAPRVLDLGCGNGRFLVASALARPELDHLGIDLVPPAVKFASLRAGQRGLANCKVAWGDASDFLLTRCPPASVAEVHLYHPQPYYDAAHAVRRQLTPAVLGAIHRALVDGGLFVFQTDNPGFAAYARRVLPALFEVTERTEPWPDAPQGRTLREITARRQGLSIVRIEARRLALEPSEAARRAASLPEPTFDANRPGFRGPRGPRRGGGRGRA